MNRSMNPRISLALCLTFAACDDGAAAEDAAATGTSGGDDTTSSGDEGEPDERPGLALNGIDGDFVAAAEEFAVPVQLLQAVGWVETRWQTVAGEEEFEGMPAAFGVMALRGERLTRAAALIGVPVERVQSDRRSNLRAGAALLAQFADELAVDRDDLAAWGPAVARYSGIPEAAAEARTDYVQRGVYAALRDGIEVSGPDARMVARPRSSAVGRDVADALDPQAAPGPDYAGSIWRPSPNFNSRPAGAYGKVGMIIIHTCEGNYAGCWGWLVNPESKVSAHYAVKEDGSEVSQLVQESKRAWHIAPTYDCALNSNTDCSRNGYSINGISVGIEHAGFANQPSWHPTLIDTSARLACAISKAHGVPRDKYHIVGHAQLQPYDRADPGPNWPWATYLARINQHCDASSPGVLVVDSSNANNDPAKARTTVSAGWISGSAKPGFYGTGYWFATTAPDPGAAAFEFFLPAAATKTIDAWWTAGADRSSAAPFGVYNAQGVELGLVKVDQRSNGSSWEKLGTFKFSAGWNRVLLSRSAPAGAVVIADAVRVR